MTRILRALLLSLGFGVALAGAAAAEEIYTGWLSNEAAGGYDVVAYFTEGRPVDGSDDFTTEWKGAEWRFSSADNLARFEADPDAYAPRYGGHCAWAVAVGKTAKGDPEHWKIVDGKLYLNYDEGVQRTWEGDIPGFIAKADANWPGVLD